MSATHYTRILPSTAQGGYHYAVCVVEECGWIGRTRAHRGVAIVDGANHTEVMAYAEFDAAASSGVDSEHGDRTQKREKRGQDPTPG